MVIVSSTSTINYNIRSISLPCRTHPTAQKLEEGLKKLKSWEQETSSKTTATAICFGLSALQELYKSIDDLLSLSLVIQSLSNQKKWVDELLDKSIRLLDICGNAKDLVSKCKENARDFQSSLRRRKGSDSKMETSIIKYLSFTRKLKRDAKRSLADLKQIDSKMFDLDPQVVTVIRALQEVNSKSISIFNSVFKFLSLGSSKQKTNRWALVERLVQKKGRVHQMENVDIALHRVCENDQSEMGGGQVHILQNRLQKLDVSFEGLENQLEVMLRCLIQSRTTLLNAISC